MASAKAPLAATSNNALTSATPNLHHLPVDVGTSSYFPPNEPEAAFNTGVAYPPAQQQQHTAQHQYLDPGLREEETLSNTLANTHLASTNAPSGSGYAHSHLIAPVATRPARFTEEWDASQRGSSLLDIGATNPVDMQRSHSVSGSTVALSGDGGASSLSRGNTLRKKSSVRRSLSLGRSNSRRSMKAGSVRSLALQATTDQAEMQNAFYCPVPTSGNPTEVLANRFQSWRKILKDLITYFREIQTHYEHRSKSLLKLANVLNNTSTPPGFLASGGLDDALQILRSYNKQSIAEANKAREIEEDVILALTGLRSDLHQKIKEIKNLSGDFKNSVEKEMEATRRTVNALQDTLGQTELDASLTQGKQDPYLLRLAVDRQLLRQIDEENYLHKAYLNLENSGRELESIVVGEIQKSYNAYAGILKREADAAYNAIDELRIGPISMPKDNEWSAFVRRDDQFIDPELPMRSPEHIQYPGRDHYACQEIRAGLLERKSKYLKSYTAGWYVLSPTHLHEFRSADKGQAPVMSLFLPEQKLGSHSSEGGSSNKFVLKGRQTGTMHRGHTWVFRAESHDTMMAWYEDIKALTEKSPEELSNFVRGHSRSFSRVSQRSISQDSLVDEDDDEPFSAPQSVQQLNSVQDNQPRRPSPGGRFPSDLEVNAQRGMQVPASPLSVDSGYGYQNPISAQGGYVQSQGTTHAAATQDPRIGGYGSTTRTPLEEASSRAAMINREASLDGVNPYTNQPTRNHDAYSANEHRASAAEVARGAVPNGRGEYGADWSEGKQVVTPQPQFVAVGLQNGAVPSVGRPVSATREQIYAASAAGTFGQPEAARPGSSYRQVDGVQKAAKTNGVVRPTAGNRTDSVPTISSLHIPGEFPRGTPTV